MEGCVNPNEHWYYHNEGARRAGVPGQVYEPYSIGVIPWDN